MEFAILNVAIETIDLTKRFPKAKSYREIFFKPFARQEITALRSISLRVEVGETFAMVGPNGAGKTTLIKILSTLVLPTSGCALVAGYDVSRHARQIRERIGCVVGEERSFYWRLTGRQNLSFFAALDNIPQAIMCKRVHELLALVGLDDDADKMFKDYSAGMRHRLAIARALLTDPQVLFLDEPTKSLDPPTAKMIRRLIASFATQRPEKTVIFATHDLLEAEELAGRIAILDRGTIKACASPRQLRETAREKKRYVLRLRRLNERASALLQRLAPSSGSNGMGAVEQCSYVIEVSQVEEVSSVIRELVLAGAQVVECIAVQPSISEVFETLTGGGT